MKYRVITEEPIRVKTCTKCGEKRSIDRFARYSSSKDGCDHYCRDCRARMERERNQKDPGRAARKSKAYRERNAEAIRTRNQAKRSYVQGMARSMGCAITGAVTNLVWHHIDPATKWFTLSNAAHYAWESIRAEMRKCVVVTVSLHAQIHSALLGQVIKNPTPEFDRFMLEYHDMIPDYDGQTATYRKQQTFRHAA